MFKRKLALILTFVLPLVAHADEEDVDPAPMNASGPSIRVHTHSRHVNRLGTLAQAESPLSLRERQCAAQQEQLLSDALNEKIEGDEGKEIAGGLKRLRINKATIALESAEGESSKPPSILVPEFSVQQSIGQIILRPKLDHKGVCRLASPELIASKLSSALSTNEDLRGVAGYIKSVMQNVEASAEFR